MPRTHGDTSRPLIRHEFAAFVLTFFFFAAFTTGFFLATHMLPFLTLPFGTAV